MSTLQNTGTSSFKQDLETLSSQAGVVKHDVSKLAHTAADTVRDGASELRDGAYQAVDSAKVKLSQAADYTKDHAADAAKSARQTVSDHPLTSLGIALGVGIIAGLLIGRPRG